MKIDKITFVTGNKGKFIEAEKILGIPLELKDIDLEEIQEIDLEKVALHKLQQAYEIVKTPVIIDDVSFSLDAWNGFPGPLIKWILKAGNGTASILLKMLEGEKNRAATAILAVGFHDGKNPYLFYGEVTGTIAEKIRGDNGFGWDAVFIPEGQTKTFGEMTVEQKNAISHRKAALDKLKDFLSAHYEI